MIIQKTDIPEVTIICPKIHGDHRGWFFESFSLNTLSENGIYFNVVQANHSYTAKTSTIRGLHFQINPKAQTKIVRCTRGKIMDVAVDLRKDSSTYLKWIMVELSEKNMKQLYIPKGFAHGFISLTPDVEIQYLVDEYYSPEDDRSIRYDDPQIGINWNVINPILSEKDLKAPLLVDSDCNF